MYQRNNGWVKLHRKIKGSSIYSNHKALHCWIECLLRAQHEGNEFFQGRTKVTLQPGQFLMGREEFGVSVGMSGSTAWYWIQQFKSDSMLDIKKTGKGSLVTVLNWNEYQKVDSYSDKKQTANEQQMNTIKNVKKEKNVKNEKNEAAQKPQEFSGKETKLRRQYKEGTVMLYELEALGGSIKREDWYVQVISFVSYIREEDLDNAGFPLRLRNGTLEKVAMYLAYKAKKFEAREKKLVHAFIRGICNPHNDFWRRFCDSTEQALGSMYDIIDEAPKTLE